MLVPKNLHTFYDELEKDQLYQGDILDASKIGLKQTGVDTSPDHWLIITKSCDLVIDPQKQPSTTRRGIIKVLPLLSVPVLNKIYGRDSLLLLERVQRKIVLVAVLPFLKGFKGMKAESVDTLVKNEMSRYLYLPPDGAIFKEPMIIDFDISESLDGADPEELRATLAAKVMQLATPFRERVAQRFAAHYATIGIDDDEIKAKTYVSAVKKFLADSKKPLDQR